MVEIGDKRDYESEVISNISAKSILSNLTNRESQILYLYANEDMTQYEIARQMGLSQANISRILKKIQRKLEREFNY